MSEKKQGRFSKAASKVGGAGKAAVKKKALDTVGRATKPVKDAVAKKVDEVSQKAMGAAEKKAKEMVKEQLKKETKKKFLRR